VGGLNKPKQTKTGFNEILHDYARWLPDPLSQLNFAVFVT